jgi:hypothetical protein
MNDVNFDVRAKLKDVERLNNEWKNAVKAYKNALNMNSKMRYIPSKYLYHPINTLSTKAKA